MPVSRKKIKQITGEESIAAEMDKWTYQNAASLEARRVETMKPEAKVLADMKIWYSDAFLDQLSHHLIQLPLPVFFEYFVLIVILYDCVVA